MATPKVTRREGRFADDRLAYRIWDVADASICRELVNPKLKRAPGYEQSHPGWIYGLQYTANGKRLVSAGLAPGGKGYLAVWDADAGKLLHGEELPLGAFHSLALLPGDRGVVVGAGPRGAKGGKDLNKAYVLTVPGMGP